ncbi:MAG TPA: restriction endonuclease [Candidatus Binatia bacterium]|nr:restriction endonuclease [Candidatus Binatia bacterium]
MGIGDVVSSMSRFDRGRKWRRDAATAALGARPDVRAVPPPGPVNLSVMSNEELERHLVAFFGRRGYTVWPTPARGSAGAAILLCRDEQGVVVQVKRWNAALGPEAVNALLEAVKQHADTLKRLGCSRIGGLVVSTASFKPEAQQLAQSSGVLLWDRQALETQLKAEAEARAEGPGR